MHTYMSIAAYCIQYCKYIPLFQRYVITCLWDIIIMVSYD